MRIIIIVLFTVIGCGTTTLNLKNLELYNTFFMERRHVTPPEGEKTFKVKVGRGNVLVTAPHTVDHIRKDRVKGPDFCTGAITKVLHDMTGVPIVYMVYKDRDPNYYDDGVEMKAVVADYLRKHPKIKLVIDIHGANRKRPFDIDLGTMHGKSLIRHPETKELIKDIFHRHGILKVSENHFTATKNATMTKFVAKHGVDAIQIEINRAYRCDSDEKTLLLLEALTEIVTTL